MGHLNSNINKLGKTLNIEYMQKWLFYGLIIGVVAGLGSAVFYFTLNSSTYFFLGEVVGFYLHPSDGEISIFRDNINYLFLILVPTLGGIMSGIVIYSLAPEAEGHGTDAVIRSFHNLKGKIRARVPLVKTVASVITIGTGGSAGREGPVAQIGAGFSSLLSDILKVREADRRILLMCGVAAGIGSIFKAPLGGALFAIAVLYKHDYEVDGIIPSMVSSIIAYSVFCSIVGWSPIFKTPEYIFSQPVELVFYAILGVVCGLIGILYVGVFYGLRNRFFRVLNIPKYLIPGIGGFMLGSLALFFPQVLGAGYGWVQEAINGNLTISLMLMLIFAKILATSFTISSGGSGGVFAPSLVIGAMIGGSVGEIFHSLFPDIIANSGAFVLVGMAAFFAGVANVPIVTLIMVCEMTNSYSLLVPLMLAEAISYVITTKWTIYENQVPTRADSPAHRHELSIDILEKLYVKCAMTKDVMAVSPKDKVSYALSLIDKYKHLGYPVISRGEIYPKDTEGEIVGIVTASDITAVPLSERDTMDVKDISSNNLITVYEDETLYNALHKMVEGSVGRLPVVDRNNPKKLVGILTKSDIIVAYVKEEERVRYGE
jgi:CIC family chloride channel protein